MECCSSFDCDMYHYFSKFKILYKQTKLYGIIWFMHIQRTITLLTTNIRQLMFLLLPSLLFLFVIVSTEDILCGLYVLTSQDFCRPQACGKGIAKNQPGVFMHISVAFHADLVLL